MGDSIKYLMFFAGAAIFALLISVLLHELGHAAAIFIAEKQIAHIALNPFAGAVTRYQTLGKDPAAARFISAGGFIFGTAFALMIASPFMVRFRNPWTIPFAMIAVTALAGNGLMLVAGVIFSNVGDVSRLLSLGVPKITLLFLGVSFLLLSGYFFLGIAPCLGLGPRIPFRKRCLITGGGLFPYLVCVLVYNAIYHPDKVMLYAVYILAGLVLGLGVICLGGYGPAWSSVPRPMPTAVIKWEHSVFACALACFLIVLFLLKG